MFYLRNIMSSSNKSMTIPSDNGTRLSLRDKRANAKEEEKDREAERERGDKEMRIWIFITRTHECSSRPMRSTIIVYDSTRAFLAKNQVNVKKQMINYRASLRTQVYLYAPGRRTGTEE